MFVLGHLWNDGDFIYAFIHVDRMVLKLGS